MGPRRHFFAGSVQSRRIRLIHHPRRLFVLYLLGRLRGLGFAIGPLIEIGEKNEEYRRVQEKKRGNQFRVSAVEDQGLSAVHEDEEELDLKQQ